MVTPWIQIVLRRHAMRDQAWTSLIFLLLRKHSIIQRLIAVAEGQSIFAVLYYSDGKHHLQKIRRAKKVSGDIHYFRD
jgi:hypothetical protein